MKSVHKSVLIWYSAQEMFDLVIDVERYPEFLPWCSHGKVLERTDNGMTAEVGIAFKGVKQTFTTRNEHVPGRSSAAMNSPTWVTMPFLNVKFCWVHLA